MKNWMKMSAFVLMASLMTSMTNPAFAKKYDGVTINIITTGGYTIKQPIIDHGKKFTELTGLKINMTGVPFSDIYSKMLTDFGAGTNSYDVGVFPPAWMVDFIVPGYLTDLTGMVKADKKLNWNDVVPFFRDFSASFDGKIYTIPVDGDFHMAYYRKDLLEKEGMSPPTTWDDYLRIAKHFHGKDLNGDGEADWGSCLGKKRNGQGYYIINSIAAPYIQSQGTESGMFFNPENMKPLVNNEGFAKALEFWKESTQYGPPNELNIDVGDTRGMFTSGRCALTVDWGDIGPLAIAEGSKVVDKVGSLVLPGSKEVIDRKTGKLVSCTKSICPHAVDGVNHAPFAAFGGWAGSINASSPKNVQEAAFAFLSYVNQAKQSNKDVVIGKTGMNPYRTSQFEDKKLWVEAGFSTAAAEDYLSAIRDSLASPNMVLDLRIPQNQRYLQISLDTQLSRMLAGEITISETMKAIEDEWEEITEELGRDEQMKAYRSTISWK